MSRRSIIVGLLAIGLAIGARGQVSIAPGATVVDGIAAVVDGEPILRSEVDDSAWYARLSAQLGETPADRGALSPAERQDALQHLEDEQLLVEAAANEGFQSPPAAQMATNLETQWAHLAELAGGEAALAAALRTCHLNRATVSALLRRQLTLVAFLNQHFSGSAAITPQQVQQYYDSTFVPAAQQHHLAAAPLAEVRATIARLLRQQQRSAEEQQWLATLRAGAHIDVRGPW